MTQSVDFNKSEQCTLSIRLSTDGFSFSLFNPLSEEPPYILDHDVDESLSLTANLKQTFREVEWLSRTFRGVNVLMSSRRFTLMPLEIFEDEQAEEVFYHNHTKRSNELVLYNILNANNVVVLFGIDKAAYTFMHDRNPAAKFQAQASVLIEHFTAKSRLGNSRKLYAHLRREAIDVFAYEHSHLLLANSYECRTTADRIYYLLYIWKQLAFDQERDELHLTGDLRDKDQLLTELRRYLRQLFVLNPATNLDLHAVTES